MPKCCESVPPTISPGATTVPGNSSRTVRSISLKDALSGGATFDGSVAFGSSFSCRPGTAAVLWTCLVSAARLSPGSRRKLTVASARPGSTFSLLPALTMVSAVVVRSIALVVAPASSCFFTRGANSHRLDSATRDKPLISGASVSNIWRATPEISAGNWRSSSRVSAWLIIAIVLVPAAGGIDEWPGVPSMPSWNEA